MFTKVHHLWTKKVFTNVLYGEIRIRSELKLSESIYWNKMRAFKTIVCRYLTTITCLLVWRYKLRDWRLLSVVMT